MRTYQEVKDKAVFLREKYLKARIDEFTCRKPINCLFAKKAKLNTGKAMLCVDDSQPEITVCDCERCKKCSRFVCKNTEESIIDDFNEIINSVSRCMQEYPKLALMLWFLQDYDPSVEKSRHWWKIWC